MMACSIEKILDTEQWREKNKLIHSGFNQDYP